MKERLRDTDHAVPHTNIDSPSDLETTKEQPLAPNITSAALAIRDTDQFSDEPEGQLFPILPFLYLCLLAFGCFFGKPIPDETHRRRRRRRLNGEKESDPMERRKFVNAALFTERVAGRDGREAVALAEGETGTTPPIPWAGGIEPTIAIEGALLTVPEANEEEDLSSCSICLEPYLIGQDVSWSRDMQCRHVFHHECVVEWLMKHDECPCCRSQYLPPEIVFQDSQKDDDDSSSTASRLPLRTTIII